MVYEIMVHYRIHFIVYYVKKLKTTTDRVELKLHVGVHVSLHIKPNTLKPGLHVLQAIGNPWESAV